MVAGVHGDNTLLVLRPAELEAKKETDFAPILLPPTEEPNVQIHQINQKSVALTLVLVIKCILQTDGVILFLFLLVNK